MAKTIGRRAAMLGAASLVACSSTPPGTAPVVASASAGGPKDEGPLRPPSNDWVVGVFASMTGLEADFSIPLLDGIRLAVDEVNKAPPKGRKLRVTYEDDRSNASNVVDVMKTLTKPPEVIAVVGGVSSAFAKVAAAVAIVEKAPLVVCTATHPSVTADNAYAFRACFTDPFQAQMAADWVVRTAKKERIAILTDPSEYSTSMATTFAARVKELGGLVVREQRVEDRADVRTLVDDLKSQRADLVYAPLFYTKMLPIAEAARKRGLSAELFFGTDAWSAPELYPWIEGAAFTDHFLEDVPGAKASAFVGTFRARFDEAPSNVAALGYDSVMLLADALARATEDTREGVRAALAATKDFVGASGRIRMSAQHDAEKNVLVARVKDGAPRYEAMVGPFEDDAKEGRRG